MKNSKIFKKIVEILYNACSYSNMGGVDTVYQIYFKSGTRMPLIFIGCRGYGVNGKGFDKEYKWVETSIQNDKQDLKDLNFNNITMEIDEDGNGPFSMDYSTDIKLVYTLMNNNEVDWDKTFNILTDMNERFCPVNRTGFGLSISVIEWQSFVKNVLKFKNSINL